MFVLPAGFTCVLADNFIYTAQFITSCPSTNPALPVTPLPMLSITDNVSPAPNSTIELTFDASGGKSAAWLSGLEAVFTPLDDNNQTTVPDSVHGTLYVAVVSNEDMPLTDANMVTGLAIVQMPYDSTAHEVDNQ